MTFTAATATLAANVACTITTHADTVTNAATATARNLNTITIAAAITAAGGGNVAATAIAYSQPTVLPHLYVTAASWGSPTVSTASAQSFTFKSFSALAANCLHSICTIFHVQVI